MSTTLENGLSRLPGKPQRRHREGSLAAVNCGSFAHYLRRASLNNIMYQIIDAIELSIRWNLPVTWIREYTRSRTKDTIPHIKFGHYTRFEWDSPELTEWLERHKQNGTGR